MSATLRRRQAAADKDSPRERRTFAKVRNAEEQYARGLRGIAAHIGQLTKAFDPFDRDQMATLQATLKSYATILGPWAKTHAARMLADVRRRDDSVWNSISKLMSRSLRQEIETAPTGELMMALLNEQVVLITSLPIEAAERVHKLTVEGLLQSTRPPEIAKEIMRSGEVSKSRANLIARTETARTASLLTQSRAQYVGSTGYIWRTAGDSDVRKEHRALAGKFIAYADPPIAGPNGMRYHAGQGPNCRCYMEPVIPDE